MSSIFVCAKCGRPHSIEEFNESRFCKNCGKFLTYRNKVAAARFRRKGRTRSETGFRRLFPYSPYPQQKEFMQDVEKFVGNKGVLVAEACNGFGKTICSLSAVLPLGYKVIYATRTHEQVRQVLQEVERMNQKAETGFSAVNLASRQHLCLNEKSRRLSSIEALEACRVLRATGKCPYKADLRLPPSSLPRVLSIRTLLGQGRIRGVCPYFLARRVAETCTVIVAPYQYIFNEAIRARVKMELSNRILIFDEAHNADKIGLDVLSDTLSERGLGNAKRELERVAAPSDFIEDLVAYLDENLSGEVVIKSGLDLRRDMERVLKVDRISSFVDTLSYAVEEIRAYKLENDEVPICHLNGVLTFLSRVDESPTDSYVAVYRRSAHGLNRVEYRCLDPSLAIKPVIEEAYGALIMSGTLSPTSLFTEIIGLSDAETRTYSAIVKPENVHAFLDASVTTKFSERSEEMIRRYGERISRLISQVPNGVLIFFPQRKFMLETLTIWRDAGDITKLHGKSFLSEKVLFAEGERASENTVIVEEYKKATRSNGGAVLLGVFRGRNAEGSNFPYEEARGIFLVGIPYADYSDPVVKAQIRYFNAKSPDLGERWYIMDAFRAANQAIGRGIRHRDDWCNFFFMDRRYGAKIELISKWAVENGVKKIPASF